MTIARVQSTGSVQTNGTISQAFSSDVTVGNHVIVTYSGVMQADGGAFVAGDCSKLSGTATIGTVSLLNGNRFDEGTFYCATAAWIAEVTGSGSLTMQTPYGADVRKQHISVSERSGDIDHTPEDTNTGENTASDTAPGTGNMTSAGAALFGGVLSTLEASSAPAITKGTDYTTINGGTLAGSGPKFAANAEDRIVTTGTTDEADWTTAAANDGHMCIGFVLKENAGSDTEVVANLETLTLTEQAASIAVDVEVNANTETLTLTEQAATISVGVDVAASTASLSLTGPQATISYDVEVTGSTQALTLTENQATVGLDTQISAGTESLTLTTFLCSVATSGINEIVKLLPLTLTTYGATIVGATPSPKVHSVSFSSSSRTMSFSSESRSMDFSSAGRSMVISAKLVPDSFLLKVDGGKLLKVDGFGLLKVAE